MLDKNFTHETEKKWQEYWAEHKIYAFDEAKLKTLDPKQIYSIDTPPPFTSGELHMGHVLSYSYFDFIARFKRMKGFNVFYPQGWDTQGFPTEVKVEKKYGRLPPTEFRQKCIEWTVEMIARMKTQMNEMGFSPDWTYEYRTMDKEYHRKVQLSLIEMYNKKMVYRSEYPVYFCTKCNSAIAKAELDDLSRNTSLNYVKFKDKKTGKEIPIATTRPELFHAVNALIVNPTDEKNKQLIGGIAIVPVTNQEIPIIADKDVDATFGTGMAMVSSYGDKADVVWCFRHKLKLTQAVSSIGKIINSNIYDGLKCEEARKKVIELLKEKELLIKQEPLTQTVKVHDRCGTPIELLNSKQWFANIKESASQIKKFANGVKWIPDFGITYLTDWVDNADWDWVISRQRIFGTPLPFYYCEKCDSTTPADLSELPYYAENAKEKKCKCGTVMKAETSTCDCWVDSSITPLIISGWPDNLEMHAKLYPISLRPQGVEIVRTWAFYTIYRSGVGLTGKAPWKEILLNGNVLAPDGKKMSKSLGNIIAPAELLKEYPTDAIRQWAALSGAMAKDRPFSYEDIKFSKSFMNKLWNAAKFVEISIADYKGKREVSEISSKNPLDIWIVSRLNQLIEESTKHFESFEYHYALNKFHNFFWKDFCDNYLEYVKHRIYGTDEKLKTEAQEVLCYILFNSIKLIAPIAPHISEEIYQQIFEHDARSNKTIHRSSWPKSGQINKQVIELIEEFNKVIGEIRRYKASTRVAQNQAIPKCTITTEKEFSNELIGELKSITKVENVETSKGEFKVEF
ncbi:MAG: valine--tRNA ligase [Candidatus Micrarchaeota archaeon]